MQSSEMATPVKLDEFAESLRRAEAARRPVPPLTERCPALSVAEAYTVQRINTGLRLAAGERIVGRKIGLTSLPMQRQLGVDEPDFGVLFASMVPPDGHIVPFGELIAPRVEAEIAFVLGKPLHGAEVTVEQVRDAVVQVVLAAEVIDSRIADWRIKLADTVRTTLPRARVVVGPTLDAPRVVGHLASQQVELFVNGERTAHGLDG